jgi:hypothetical protein
MRSIWFANEIVNVFCGYSGECWVLKLLKPSDSFKYSFVNKINKPIKIKWSKNKKFDSYSSFGPTFGSGHDFYIANKSNTNTNSFSDLGLSYSHPEYAYGSNEARSFLAGSHKFKILEIEVFSKIEEKKSNYFSLRL